MRTTALIWLVSAAACGGDRTQPEFPKTPKMETTAALAGHRCKSTLDGCACRGQGDDEETSPPADGFKRFEFRVTSSDGEAWVTVDDAILYKNVERAEDCFYLDLLAGDHTILLHAKSPTSEGGVGAGLRVSEHHAGQWYETFRMSCGAPGPCDKDSLLEWKEAVSADRTRMWDPCGTTKVRGLAWQTGRMPDALHPVEFLVEFTLMLAERAPAHPPRSEDCPLN